jgi:sugar/nucleoside kinase (ribokinase family)
MRLMQSFDVYGIGAALVDMEYAVDDVYLRQQSIDKGHMTLIDEDRLNVLLRSLDGMTPTRASGGSAANTVFAAQSFGASTFYSCKVAGDETGSFFLNDLRRAGVATNPHSKDAEGTSGRCLVLVTPDAERSMSTFLGISAELGVAEVYESALRNSRALYMEGYLATSESAKRAAIHCREIAERHHLQTMLTLSDPTIVRFFRASLEAMLGNGVSVLFCNEEEALDWAGTDRLDIAVRELKDIGRSLYVTLGSRGSLVSAAGLHAEVPGFGVKAIDTNGAGDIYAGACVYGGCVGMPPQEAARLGNFAASRLVTRYGARLKTPAEYRHLLADFRTLPR